MSAAHLELLVEEPSMEAFLRALLPRLLPQDRSFEVHPFQGKNDLLGKLESRLRGYAAWIPADWRIVVVVDRDDQDCLDQAPAGVDRPARGPAHADAGGECAMAARQPHRHRGTGGLVLR